MQNENCLVCYEAIEPFDCIILECDHGFCRFCADNIAFHEICKCPLDLKTSQVIRENNIEKTVIIYQLEAWNRGSVLEPADLEKFWSTVISKLVSIVSSIDVYFKESWVDEALFQFDELQSSQYKFVVYEKIAMIQNCYSSLGQTSPSNINSTRKIFLQTPSQYQSPIERNIIKTYFENDIQLFSFELKQHLHKYENIYDLSKCKELFPEMVEMTKEKIIYFTGMIISNVTYNTDIYKTIRSFVKITDTHRCLMCYGQIVSEYAKFPKCQHKICCICVNKFMIIHGSCPFDCFEIEDLQMHIGGIEWRKDSETASKFLTSQYEDLMTSYFQELLKSFVPTLKKILGIKYKNPGFIEQLACIHDEMNSKGFGMKNAGKFLKDMKLDFANVSESAVVHERYYLQSKVTAFTNKISFLNYISYGMPINNDGGTIVGVCQELSRLMVSKCYIFLRGYDAFRNKLSSLLDGSEELSFIKVFLDAYRTWRDAILAMDTDHGALRCTEFIELFHSLKLILVAEQELMLQCSV